MRNPRRLTYGHIVPKAVQSSGTLSELNGERMINQFIPGGCAFTEEVLDIILLLLFLPPFYAGPECNNLLFPVDVSGAELHMKRRTHTGNQRLHEKVPTQRGCVDRRARAPCQMLQSSS